MNWRGLLAFLVLATFPLTTVALGLFGFGGSPSGSGISPDGSQINTLDSIGGSLTTKYGVWTFGPGVTPPTGANPPGPFYTFNYVKLNGRVVNRIGLFGITGRTGASQIVVNYGGEVFFLTTENDRSWYQMVNYDGLNGNVGNSPCLPCVVDPSYVIHAAGPNALPPFTPTPGTISSAPGCITSLDGVWCNGAGGASWQPTLNGIPFDPAHGGSGTDSYSSLTVACNGNAFALKTVENIMVEFMSFNVMSAGSGSSLPTCPVPINVAVTPNPALVSGSIPGPQIAAGTSSGIVASFAVTMSDGSLYSGTPTFANSYGGTAPATFLGISGSNIVLTGPATHGQYFVGVQTVSGADAPGPWLIEVTVN